MKFFNISKYLLASLFLFNAVTSSLSASILEESNSSERVSFYFKDLRICHQLEWRNMTLQMEFDGQLQDLQAVKKFVKSFLGDYPNEMDFWEIMNAKLVHAIVQQFPEIGFISSQIALAPDRTLSFPRRSSVIYSQEQSALKETFSFTKLNYKISNETFDKLDFHVSFDIKDNPDTFDYPDYQWVDAAMEEFFKQHPMSVNKWTELKPKLESDLLKRFTTLTSMKIDVVSGH